MITYSDISKNGSRNVNEDYLDTVFEENKAFFCLADGLGGHGKGDLASKLTIKEAFFCFEENEDLGKCIEYAQNKLLAEQKKLNVNDEMKTTFVCLKIKENIASWGHVGDSRLYFFRNNKLSTRTLDHSVPQMLVATGEIKEKDIRFHEDRNRLIRVMGMEWNSPKYDISDEVKLQNKDSFLLCSDGFWELIDEKEITKLLKKSKTPQEWLFAMEEVILKNGKDKNMDNYSAIAVFVRQV